MQLTGITGSIRMACLQSGRLLPFGFMLAVFAKAINEFVTVGSIWEIFYATIGNAPLTCICIRMAEVLN
jgi:hypothetical protein